MPRRKRTSKTTVSDAGAETVTATAPVSTDTPPEVVADVRDASQRIKEALAGAEEDGIVSAIEVGRPRGRPRASSPPEAPAPVLPEGMDLTLLSGMILDGLSQWRGWDEAGCPVSDAEKANWGAALAPVAEKWLSEAASRWGPEITLLTATALLVGPRERLAYQYRKAHQEVPHGSV